MRYPSGTNLLKLCLPTDIHLSPAILLQEAFWSVKHPVELPQDLLQPGCNWVASFLLLLLPSPGLFISMISTKVGSYSSIRTWQDSNPYWILFNFIFDFVLFMFLFWDHFGETYRKRKAARDLEEPFSRWVKSKERDILAWTKSCDRSGMLRKMPNEENFGKIWKVRHWGWGLAYQRGYWDDMELFLDHY